MKRKKLAINSKNIFFLKEFPYSQAIQIDNFLFISGIVSEDIEGRLVGEGDVIKQSIQIFENIKKILHEVKLTMRDVVKINMYFRNIDDLKKIVEIRRKYFNEPYPCSTAVEVSRLLNSKWLLEIEAIASF